MPSILIPEDRDDAAKLARLLLDAAGDEPERVAIVSDGGRRAYAVDDDLFDKAQARADAAGAQDAAEASQDDVDHGITGDVPEVPDGPNAGDDDTAETPAAKPATRKTVAARKAAAKAAATKTDGDD